ncbi:helix-turn-helix transcriptional regulator [Mycobacterium sp. 852002-51057_SCH5723018]|uniref:helix-turn-helix transcriptional regulator n=1 Tax=Mycobacterium sp. 852002-51057_SCH5723018 TaxID=1834094 RepID=UPI0007FF5936|nr:helix-turn-helix transcriptional regulator [Mycobacterium sp. 852002-51057_SCH5723018]OBG29726.1 AraC family transcriptional regulator [Mycobacterium sp. 852002-51057_SCH5723018]
MEVDLRAAPATYASPGYSPAAVRYEQFRTVDQGAARRFFAGAYTPGWRINGHIGRWAITHQRCAAGSMTIDEVVIEGRLGVEIPPADSVVVIQPRAGSLAVTGVPFPHVECPVLVAHGMSCALQVNGARFDVVTIQAEALNKVAAESHTPLSQQVRFLSCRPRSRGAVPAWHRALEYATATLAAPETAQQPLVVAMLAPLLAGALLECYPSNVTELDPASDPALPATLKDAVAFIHRHAAADIGINDVAGAVHLTPRAVQYLFRRQLDTTPTEYLRRVRLHRAHQELMAGGPTTATVTEIAQRWGFAHTGRFAVLYRQTYGQSPHTTLKQTM